MLLGFKICSFSEKSIYIDIYIYIYIYIYASWQACSKKCEKLTFVEIEIRMKMCPNLFQ